MTLTAHRAARPGPDPLARVPYVEYEIERGLPDVIASLNGERLTCVEHRTLAEHLAARAGDWSFLPTWRLFRVTANVVWPEPVRSAVPAMVARQLPADEVAHPRDRHPVVWREELWA